MSRSNRQGRVFQINASPGGVPKLARLEGEVSVQGLSGDRQRETRLHGGPDRALCLYPLEHLLALQEEGHAVFPGAMGENLTLTGLEWAQLEPGARLRIGDSLHIEITGYTNPCHNLRPYFIEGDYSRVSQKRFPGWSRVYARVLQPGPVRVGDPVWIGEANG